MNGDLFVLGFSDDNINNKKYLKTYIMKNKLQLTNLRHRLNLLLCLVVLLAGAQNAMAGTVTTVYLAISASTVGSYTVKLNVNYKGDGEDWHQFNMTKTAYKYNSKDVYTYTFTDAYNGLGKLQFQLYSGSTWKEQDQAISSWTTVSTYNNKLWEYKSVGWKDFTPCIAPTVNTGTATVTGSTTATLAGTFTEGETAVTEAGFAISTSSSSGFTNYKGTIDGSDITLDKTSLAANTKYYYKTYVIDGCGTFYGSETKNFTTYKAGPDNLYIKGPLYYGSWSGNYTQPDGYSKSGNVYTFPFNATNAEPSYGENRWFVIATSTASGSGETKIQNLMEGEQVGWSFETKDTNNTFVADENIVTSTSTPITITVTYNEATEKYSMIVEPVCTEPTAQEVTIGASEICSTGSTTISLGGSQSGYTYELYKDGATTGKTVACTGEAVSFTEISAAGTYSVKGYQSNLATCISDMSNTVTLSTIPDMALTSITLSKSSDCVGKTITITPNGYNAGGSGSITYSSTDTSVATVDGTTVTVVGAGSTTIKAKVTGGCGSDIERTANLSGAGVAISGPSPSPIHEYEPTTFTASATADWAVSPASNEAYLLTDTGSSTILKAKKGTYTISATKDNCTSTKQVTVTEWPNRCN